MSGVRREIATSTFGTKSSMVGRVGDDDNDVEEGRMTPLIAALPSSQKASNKNSNGNDKNNNEENNIINNKKDQTVITTALQTLEKDMALLDNIASSQSQLSGAEVGLLLGAVAASGLGPIAFPGTSVTEVLAPAAAACKLFLGSGLLYLQCVQYSLSLNILPIYIQCIYAVTASITIGSEYLGRVAVADGKEYVEDNLFCMSRTIPFSLEFSHFVLLSNPNRIAANSIQCAAEAEGFLANAERVKAITPLCVGVGATCASFALLTPTIVEALNIGNSVIVVTELYLLCPLVSVLSAAVANLALEETRGFASRAINVGVRRFSKSGMVGRTWLSSSEQVQRNSKSKTDRWWSFAGSVLPAPIIGSVVGGPSLSAKCIIVAALAAAQSAYFLAQAESVVARATDAVALKARSAAVCDT